MANDSHTNHEDAALDETVWRALEPLPDAIPRLVAVALGTHGPRTPGPLCILRSRRALVAAAFVLVVAAAVGGLMWPRTPGFEPRSRGLMTNEGQIIVIEMKDHPVTLIAPRAMTSSVPSGTVSIVLLGESQ